MRIKFLLMLVIVATMWSCAHVPDYLPKLNNLGSSPYGAFIRVNQRAGIALYGELIAADSAAVYVLTDRTYHNMSRCVKISVEDVTDFRLRFAAPGRYGWSMPVFGLLVSPITSGFLSIFTAPMNFIVTGSIVVGSYQSTIYTAVDIKKIDLWKFARYPQGLPPDLDLNSVK
jgi:hypothetical protein